jgi:hypothetical protein
MFERPRCRSGAFQFIAIAQLAECAISRADRSCSPCPIHAISRPVQQQLAHVGFRTRSVERAFVLIAMPDASLDDHMNLHIADLSHLGREWESLPLLDSRLRIHSTRAASL